MIKNSLRAIMYVSLCILMVNSPLHLQSQIPVPSRWNNFVQDVSQNISVRDTFLFQSFENELSDTWSYTITGRAAPIDVLSLYGVKGQKGKYTLKLPPASGVEFVRLKPSSLYTDVCIHASYAASNLSQGDKLVLEIFSGEAVIRSEWYKTPSGVKTFSFGAKGTPILLQNNPRGIEIGTPDTNKGTCFLIDCVCAFGLIPQYSLFTDKGDWNDKNLWTHLPVLRHRSALVNGDVSILSDVQCKDLAAFI